MDSREKTVVSRFYGAHKKASLAPFVSFQRVLNFAADQECRLGGK